MFSRPAKASQTAVPKSARTRGLLFFPHRGERGARTRNLLFFPHAARPALPGRRAARLPRDGGRRLAVPSLRARSEGPLRAALPTRKPSTRRPSAVTAAGFRTNQAHVTSLLSADRSSRRFLALTLNASVAAARRSPAIARRPSRPRARLCACRGTVCIQPKLRRGLPLRSWCFPTESAWSRHLRTDTKDYSSSPTYIADAGIGGY